MLTRSNLFLAALLVVQIVLLAISVVVTNGTESRTTEPILAGMAAADVERITVADNLENQMTFARNEDGWVLPNADDFPLNGEQVDEMSKQVGRHGYAPSCGVKSGQLCPPRSQGR